MVGIRILGKHLESGCLAGNRSYKGGDLAEEQGQLLTRISRQAALRRVI